MLILGALGTDLSRLIVAEAGSLILPAESLTLTVTVFVPSPSESSICRVADCEENCIHRKVLNSATSPSMNISVASNRLCLSLANSTVSITFCELETSFPSSMDTPETMGGVLSIETVRELSTVF